MQASVQPTTVQPAAALPTTVQPAVTRVQPATVAPTTVQPATVQPTTVDHAVSGAATTIDPAHRPAGGWQPAGTDGAAGNQPLGTAPPGAGGDGGTQVLFLGGDAWQVPGGGPGQSGPAQGNRYGYQQAQRRRRWLMGGLAAGTAAAVAAIAVIVASLGSSSSSTDADSSPTPARTHAATTPPASPTPSASPSTSATTGGSLLSDEQSGLSYAQLPAPWQPMCPSDLTNGSFTWTAGEEAIAGQVNSGQTTWYGEACSGPLPQQYGYSGVADLDTVATNLANMFQNSYYNALQHTVTQELSQPIQISGHAGWEVTYDVSYTDAAGQGANWTDEQAAVIVADTGTGNTPAVFFTSIPGNLGESNVSTLVSSLQLTEVPNDSGSPAGNAPTNTTAPSDFGSPPGNNP